MAGHRFRRLQILSAVACSVLLSCTVARDHEASGGKDECEERPFLEVPDRGHQVARDLLKGRGFAVLGPEELGTLGVAVLAGRGRGALVKAVAAPEPQRGYWIRECGDILIVRNRDLQSGEGGRETYLVVQVQTTPSTFVFGYASSEGRPGEEADDGVGSQAHEADGPGGSQR